MQRCEDRQEGGRAGAAGIRREVEQHDRDLAIRALGGAWHQPRDAARQHLGALGAGCIRAARRAARMSTRAQPVQAALPRSERPPNTIGPVAPSSSGIATIMVASTGIRPRSDAPHCSSVWNSTGWAAR